MRHTITIITNLSLIFFLSNGRGIFCGETAVNTCAQSFLCRLSFCRSSISPFSLQHVMQPCLKYSTSEFTAFSGVPSVLNISLGLISVDYFENLDLRTLQWVLLPIQAFDCESQDEPEILALSISNNLLQVKFTAFSVGQFQLAAGRTVPGGLLGSYFENDEFLGEPKLSRIDSVVDFHHTSFGIDFHSLSIRWCGCLMAYDSLDTLENEIYTFSLHLSNAEDSAMLMLNSKVLIDVKSPSATIVRGTITLRTGIFYNIMITYTSASVDLSSISLMWSSPTRPLQPVPQDRLFSVQPFLEDVQSVRVLPGSSSAFKLTSLSVLTLATVGYPLTFAVSIRDIFGNSMDGAHEFQALAILRNESIGFRDLVTSMQLPRNSISLEGLQLLTKSGMFQFVIGVGSFGYLHTTFYNDVGLEQSNLSSISFARWSVSNGYQFDPVNLSISAPSNFTATSLGYMKGIHSGLTVTFISSLSNRDERVKLWLDDSIIIEQWSSLASLLPSGTFQFEGNEYYSIKVEYRNFLYNLGGSRLGPRLSWIVADKFPQSSIPDSVLLSVFLTQPFQLYVLPGLPFPSESYIVGPTICTAGILSTFSMVMRDKFGNTARNLLEHFQMRKVSSVSVTFYQAYTISRISLRFADVSYDEALVGDFVATLSGQGLLVALMTSVHLSGSPHNVWIMPGAVSCATSIAKGDGLTVATAGSMSIFYVDLKDKYGNEATPASPDFNVVLYSSNMKVAEFDSFQSILQDSKLIFHYNITLAIPYFISVAQSQCNIQGSPFNMCVVSGPTCAIRSFLVGFGLSIATAGFPTVFQIRAFDEYGNIKAGTTGHDEFFIFRFMLQNSIITEGISDICSENLHCNQEDCNSSTITYTLTRAGTYRLDTYLARSRVTSTFYSNFSMSPVAGLVHVDYERVSNLSMPLLFILPRQSTALSPAISRLSGFLHLEAPHPLSLTMFADINGSNGRLRLWIENLLILEQWTSLSLQMPNCTYYFARGAGFYEIQIEYQNIVNDSLTYELPLLWSSSNLSRSESSLFLSLYASYPLTTHPTITVMSSELCASLTFARGSSLSLATAGLFSPFIIVACDQFGNRYDNNFSYILGLARNNNESVSTVGTAGYVVTQSGQFTFSVKVILNGGLHSTFYSDTNFQVPFESSVSVGASGCTSNASFDPILQNFGEYYSARWSGFLKLNSTGIYTFYADEKYAMRLIVDSEVVFDYNPTSRNDSHGVVRINNTMSDILSIEIKLSHATQQPLRTLRLQWKPPWSNKPILIPASCLLFEEHIRGSPFLVAVQAGESNASASAVFGSSLTSMTVGMVSTFVVHCKDGFGNPVQLARNVCCGLKNCSQSNFGMTWGIVAKLRPLNSTSRSYQLTSSFVGNGQWDILTDGLTRAGRYEVQIMFPCAGGLVGQFASLKNFHAGTDVVHDERLNCHPGLETRITSNSSSCNDIMENNYLNSVFVLWSGLIYVPCPNCSKANVANYSFRFDLGSSKDRIKLWIENTVVIDQWTSLATMSAVGFIQVDSMREMWSIEVWNSDLNCSLNWQMNLLWNSTIFTSLDYVKVPASNLFSFTSISDLPVVEVMPSYAAASYFLATGSGITLATAGSKSNFLFRALDVYGNKLLGKVLTNNVKRNVTENRTLSVAALFQSNSVDIGQQNVEYILTVSGQYTIDVLALIQARLQATYYSSGNFSVPIISGMEELIDPGFNLSMPYFAQAARLEGLVDNSRDQFGLSAISVGSPSDRLKLWVDSQLLVEQWTSLAWLVFDNLQSTLPIGYANFIIEYKRSTLAAFPALFSISSSRIFSILRLEDVQGSDTINVHVLPADLCASYTYAFGQSISVASVGIQSIFTIQTRDAYANYGSVSSVNFVARLGSSFSARLARPGSEGRMYGFYSTTQSGTMSLHVAQCSSGGLIGHYFNNLFFDGDPGMVMLNDDSMVRPSQKIRRKPNYAAMRWTGFVQADTTRGVGLQATYFNDVFFSPSSATSSIGLSGSGAIDFSLLQNGLPAGSSLDSRVGYAIRWSGFIFPSQFGFYTFYASLLSSQDSLMLWVDNSLLINHSLIYQVNLSSVHQDNTTNVTRPAAILQNAVALQGGSFYQMQIEYQHKESTYCSQQGLTLSWSYGYGVRPIESRYLFPADLSSELVPHYFFFEGGGWARLWIGGVLILDSVGDQSPVCSTPMYLSAGTLYEIRLEFRPEIGSNDFGRLSWKTDFHQESTPIPTYLLWSSMSTRHILGSPYLVYVHPGPICSNCSKLLPRSSNSRILVGQEYSIAFLGKDTFGNHLSGNVLGKMEFFIVLRHSVLEFYSSFLNRYITTETTNINKPASCIDALCTASISTRTAGVHSVSGYMISGGDLNKTYYNDSSFQHPIQGDLPSNATQNGDVYARWSGFMKPSIRANYTFYVVFDYAYERARLWIDSALVIDQWTSLSSLDANETFALDRDNYHEIKLDLRTTLNQNFRLNQSKLQWSHPSTQKKIISSSVLFSGTQIGNDIDLFVLPDIPQGQDMCYGRGFGLTISEIGVLSQFTVLARDQYGNEPAAESILRVYASRLHGPASEDWTFQQRESAFEAEILWNSSAYLVSYKPFTYGLHNLTAIFIINNRSFHICGSPFQLIIYPSVNASSKYSIASGDGLTLSTAGIRSCFTITAIDRWGEFQHPDLVRIGMFVHGHHLPLGYRLEGLSGMGSYSLSYIPEMIGEFSLKICFPLESGLFAEYFSDTTFLTKTLSRIDREIDFKWQRGRPGTDPFVDVRKPSLAFAARWTGYVFSALDQIHTFGIHLLEQDERVRLWIDDILLVDQWRSINSLHSSGSIQLHVGFARFVKLEYYGKNSLNGLRLTWKSDGRFGSIIESVVPGNSLAPLCESLPDSPFHLHVVPNVAGVNSRLTGDSLSVLTAGQLATFIIILQDAFGAPSKLQRSKKLQTGIQTKSSELQRHPILVEHHTAYKILFGHEVNAGSGPGHISVSILTPGELSSTFYVTDSDQNAIPVTYRLNQLDQSCFGCPFCPSRCGYLFQGSEARWRGFLRPTHTGIIVFSVNLTEPERIQLWLDNMLVIDQWTSLSSLSFKPEWIVESPGEFYAIDLAFRRGDSVNVSSILNMRIAGNPSLLPFVLYSAVPLRGLPLPVIVESAKVCSALSKIFGQSTITAGTTYKFSLVAQDRFGNFKIDQPFHASLRKYPDSHSWDEPTTCVPDFARSICLSGYLKQAGLYEISAHSIISGGLAAILYSDDFFSEPLFQRVVEAVDMEWLEDRDVRNSPSQISYCCVRWFGYLSVPVTDTYAFIVPSNCRLNMIFDDVQLSFEGNTDSGLGFRFPPRHLHRNVYYFLDLRCTVVQRPAFLQLRWKSSLMVSEQIIPSDHLFHSGSAISNSPLAFIVHPQILCASMSCLHGEGLTVNTAGNTAKFSILARDEYNNFVDTWSNFAFSVAIKNSSSKDLTSIHISKSDIDEEISVEYTMTIAGSYALNALALFQGGITATYFTDSLLTATAASGSEVVNCIDWSSTNPFHLDNSVSFSVPIWSARWYGFFQSPDMHHSMQINVNSKSERVKIWIDDWIMLDQWASLDALEVFMPVHLEERVAFHKIKVEYASAFDSQYRALSLSWKTTSDADGVLQPDMPLSDTLFRFEAMSLCSSTNLLPGLHATFYEYSDSTLPVFTAEYDEIDFSGKILHSHGEGSLIRWSGLINPKYFQEYTIYARMKETDERVRLWIDNLLIIDQWSSLATLDAAGRIVFGRKGDLYVTESRYIARGNLPRLHDLEIHYRNSGGTNGLTLEWISSGADSIAREVISKKNLRYSLSLHSDQPVLYVTAGTLCISHSVAVGSALTLSTAGALATFLLRAKDKFHNPIDLIDETLQISATFVAAPQLIPSPSYLGSFSVLVSLSPLSFTSITKAGSHILSLGGVVMGGLSATYFVISGEFAIPIESVDADTSLSRDFRHVNGGLEILANVSSQDLFCARWEGFLQPPSSSLYTFSGKMPCLDDRIQLWINDFLVIDQWSSLDLDIPSGTIQLSQDLLPFKLVLQYRLAQISSFGLYWVSSENDRSTIDPFSFGFSLQFQGSPFQHMVVPSVVCASTSIASGVGLTLFTAGTTAMFSIFAHDQYRNRKTSGGDKFMVDRRSSRTNSLGHGQLSDLGNGTYVMSIPAFNFVDSYRLSCSLLLVGGLYATYYADSPQNYPLATSFFNSITLLRLETTLLSTKVTNDNSIMARWSGYLLHDFGTRTFEIYTYYTQLLQPEDRVRLWLDNMLIIDQWTSRSSPTPSGILNLTSDDPYVLIDLWYEHTYGDAFLELTWQSAITVQNQIPSSRLFAAHGLSGFPLSVSSVAGPYCAASTTAGGEGLTLADLCSPSSFTVMVRDSYYNPVEFNFEDIFARTVLSSDLAVPDTSPTASKANSWEVRDEMILFESSLNASILFENGRYFAPLKYSVTYTSAVATRQIRVSLVGGPDLVATYYAGTSLKENQSVAVRFYDEIDYSSSAGGWPKEFENITFSSLDGFSIRWAGFVQTNEVGSHLFYFGLGHWISLDYRNQEVTVTDERVRIWIDNRMIIDQWTSLFSTTSTAVVILDMIRLYDIRIEYKHCVSASDAYTPKPFGWSLRWEQPFKNSSISVISGNYFFHGDDISGSPFTASIRAPILAASGPANGPTSGNTVVYLIGDGFGYVEQCGLAVLVAETYAESMWLSSTSMRARVPPGLGADHNISLIAGSLKSQPATYARFSYDAPSASFASVTNGPVSGKIWIVVRGMNLGTFDSTPRVRLGATSCAGTRWISNEQVECKIPAGDGLLREITITVQGQIDAWGTLSQVFSYDLLELLTYDVSNLTSIKTNVPSTGSVSISIIGANFGLDNPCANSRFGGTSCEASDWIADTAMSCKESSSRCRNLQSSRSYSARYPRI